MNFHQRQILIIVYSIRFAYPTSDESWINPEYSLQFFLWVQVSPYPIIDTLLRVQAVAIKSTDRAIVINITIVNNTVINVDIIHILTQDYANYEQKF